MLHFACSNFSCTVLLLLRWWCRCVIFNRIKRCISSRNRRKTGRSNELVCCDKGDSCLRNWKNIPSKQVNNVNTCTDSNIRPRETKSLHGSLTKSYPCDAMCGLSISYQFLLLMMMSRDLMHLLPMTHVNWEWASKQMNSQARS